MPHETPILRADEPAQGVSRLAQLTRRGRPTPRLGIWTLSLLLHAAALGLGLLFVPISTADTHGQRPIAIVIHSGGVCESDIDADEDDLMLECVDVAQVLVEAPPPLEPLVPEDEQECEDLPPLEKLPAETLLEGKPDALAFEVPLSAAKERGRVPPPPLAAPALPVSTPQRTSRPAAERPPVHVAVATAPRKPVRSARPRPARAALRIRYAPSVTNYYPRSARRLGHEGTAIVIARIEQDGLVSTVTLAQSTGYASLDAAALRLAREYRFFAPGVPRRARMPIAFVLQRSMRRM